jgi:predicted MPP superfamily phosphohydrolase
MRIQYFSDIHLEFYKKLPTINITAPILCLAGDIGYPKTKIYEDFLISLNANIDVQKVFLITGNHEYYNNSIDNVDKHIENIIEKYELNKISFLNNSSEIYGEYLFVGSTLWSHVNNKKYLTNDFKLIEDMTIDKFNSLHDTAKTYIKNTIETNKDKKIILLTHFLPSFQLIHEKYLCYSEYNNCFASNCYDLIQKPVILNIYGHTHTPNNTIINNIPCVCNSIGYPGENENSIFDKFIDIE